MSRRPDLPLVYYNTAEQAELLLDLMRAACAIRNERSNWETLTAAIALLRAELERMRDEGARRAEVHAQRWGRKG